MPIIGVVLNPGATGEQVSELHKQLSELGAVIAPAEQTAQRFGDDTTAAVRSFQEQRGLPPTGVLDGPTARLMHLASAFAGPGGRAALQAAVKEVAPATQNSQPAELAQLTRMAIVAGDYPAAEAFAKRAAGQQQVQDVLLPIIALPTRAVEVAPTQAPAAILAERPEAINPENFYVYHRDLYPLDVLTTVQRLVKDVGEPPRDPSQAHGPELGPDFGRGSVLIAAAVSWFEAIRQWQLGNVALDRREYGIAQAAYDACQSAACDYFSQFHAIDLGSGPVNDRLSTLIRHLDQNKERFSFLWSLIAERRGALTLEELRILDFPDFLGHETNLLHPRLEPMGPLTGAPPAESDFGLGFIQYLLHREELSDPQIAERQLMLETPLIIIAVVLAALARAEANRARRQYEAAVRDLRWVLDSPTRLACEFIELPFARLLLAETLLDKADAEYKARIAADPLPAPDVSEFQGLKAAQSYLALKNEFARSEPQYVARVETGREHLIQQIQDRLANNDTTSSEFQLIGKDILVPTLDSFSSALPGLDRRVKAHEPLLKFTPPDGQAMRETNPRVYAVLLTATARLEQLRAGFNYLGYLDSYVPPWRFQFLLERARYFAEHAKNAQREYLNFLSNAEREEFQELSASQNVEMEKSNLRIETARVDQVRLEVAAAQQSVGLAEQSAFDAKLRLDKFQEFDQYADELFHTKGMDPLEVEGISALTADFHHFSGGVLLGVGDFFARGTISSRKQVYLANAQREVEKFNLELARIEALRAADVARAQLAAAQAGLVVAGLQRQAALLRHEFALQNLQFLRNRTLNTEQWYRLVAAIRSVSETYLRYSIELAFLAEQAYEFEADKRLNVIRFDYDLSEVGDFLAADFLLRDLDTLEKDLIVTQRQRQQHVRYVLSMAREFSEALQEIREAGKTIFSLRLEQLEKRFPGLFNLRIGAVDVLPIALMDSTRFSLELTHLGTSQVRLKAQPDTPPGVPSPSPLNQNDLEQFLFTVATNGFADELDEGEFSDPLRQQFTQNGLNVPSAMDVRQVEPGSIWRLSSTEPEEKFLIREKEGKLHMYRVGVDDDWLVGIRDEWPVRVRVTDPETAVFSGLTRQEASAVFAFATAGQRQAFEALGAAAAWQVDFTARENQVVPGTLADVLITLTLSGYHDPELRRAMDRAPRTTAAATHWLSGQTTFPDALYEFNRSGRMVWNVTRDLLTLTDTLGAVRNVAVLLLPAPGTANYYGRLMSHCQVRVRITETGDLEVLSEIPEVTFTNGDAANPLSLTAQATLPPGAEISWEFGDGSARQIGASQQHSYARPGRYTVSLRVVRNGRLSKFQAELIVSRIHAHRLSPPVTVFPTLTRETGPDIPEGHTRMKGTANIPAGDSIIAQWRVGEQGGQKGDTAIFDLLPGDYTLFFTAVRVLKACVYSDQRQVAGPALDFNGLSLASNRRFDLDGTETTGVGNNPPANPLTTQLFTDGVLSPEDEWTIEFPLADNPGLRNVSATDAEQVDLAEIQDVILALEYETTPGGS